MLLKVMPVSSWSFVQKSSIKEISSQLGFCSQYYFTKLFKEKMKKTPSKFREGNGGQLK